MSLDLSIIKSVMDQVTQEIHFEKQIPVFSFEGLPGAGKTTQIIKASRELNDVYGKSYYIDLPTDSSVGLLLSALYSNKEIWESIRIEHPWVNPVLLSMDLRLSIEKAQMKGSKYILMSRGILSTYYYNFSVFMEKYNDFDMAWDELTRLLAGFVLPDVIVFFDIRPEEAHQRILERNREPLREMDKIENMTADLKLFESFIDRLRDDIPIHYIDGSMSKNHVTDSIRDVLSGYLEKSND